MFVWSFGPPNERFPKFFIAIDSYTLEFPDGEDRLLGVIGPARHASELKPRNRHTRNPKILNLESRYSDLLNH